MEKAYDHISIAEESVCHKLYEDNELGRKAHGGFYRYGPISHARYGPLAEEGGIRDSPTLIKERLISPMLSEAVRLLEEGIVEEPQDINSALMLGAGLPPFKEDLLQATVK